MSTNSFNRLTFIYFYILDLQTTLFIRYTDKATCKAAHMYVVLSQTVAARLEGENCHRNEIIVHMYICIICAIIKG